MFEASPDAFIQQSVWWADAIRELGPDEPVFLLCAEEGRDLGGLPLYLFRAPTGNILTSVPQAGPLGGVFLRPGLDAATRARAYAALLGRAVDLARERDCVALTVITNPFQDDLETTRAALAPALVFENFTQHVPVPAAGAGPLPFEVTASTHLTRNLRKAEAAGLRAEPCTTEEDFLLWCRLHEARHREIGATPLDPRLLAGIRRHLEPRGKAFLLLVRQGEALAAGTLFIRHHRVMDAFMPAMDSRFAAVGPNYVSAKAALLRAREQGVAILNWQGSPSRASGVYTWKQRWSSVETRYGFVTRLLRPPERIRAIGLAAARAAYAGHYLVPFAFFEEGRAEGRYARA